MGAVHILLTCCIVAIFAQEFTLEADRPWLKVKLFHKAFLECCYRSTAGPFKFEWRKKVGHRNISTDPSGRGVSHLVTRQPQEKEQMYCHTLTIMSTQLNDTGMYRCVRSSTNTFTYGTYLLVYKPLEKTINLSEGTKNKILIAEGILLLLCVLLPSSTLLCKSRKLYHMEKKKAKLEKENIYQGLNLDDCCTTYDQIERSKGDGPYQDVANVKEVDEVQLERP